MTTARKMKTVVNKTLKEQSELGSRNIVAEVAAKAQKYRISANNSVADVEGELSRTAELAAHDDAIHKAQVEEDERRIRALTETKKAAQAEVAKPKKQIKINNDALSSVIAKKEETPFQSALNAINKEREMAAEAKPVVPTVDTSKVQTTIAQSDVKQSSSVSTMLTASEEVKPVATQTTQAKGQVSQTPVTASTVANNETVATNTSQMASTTTQVVEPAKVTTVTEKASSVGDEEVKLSDFARGLTKTYAKETSKTISPINFMVENKGKMWGILMTFGVPLLIAYLLVTNVAMISDKIESTGSVLSIVFYISFYIATVFVWFNVQVVAKLFKNIFKQAVVNLAKSGKEA